jgi:nitrogen fixation NifU-like protein
MSENKDREMAGMALSERALDYGLNPKYYGDMDGPDSHARITGPCGDTVDIYLRIGDGVIDTAKFVTDGCLFSIAACNAASHLAIGKTIEQCRNIDQHIIIEHLNGLPDDHAHCALLAAKTLHKAVANYTAGKASSAAPANPAHKRTKPKNRYAGSSHGRMKGSATI